MIDKIHSHIFNILRMYHYYILRIQEIVQNMSNNKFLIMPENVLFIINLNNNNLKIQLGHSHLELVLFQTKLLIHFLHSIPFKQISQ